MCPNRLQLAWVREWPPPPQKEESRGVMSIFTDEYCKNIDQQWDDGKHIFLFLRFGEEVRKMSERQVEEGREGPLHFFHFAPRHLCFYWYSQLMI